MREKNQDMRYRRTQRNLRTALVALLQEKSIDRISVRELALRADINRATFYLHYDSPYTLLSSLEDQLFEKIIASYKANAVAQPETFFLTLYRCILDNRTLAEVLFRQNAATDFWGKLSDALQTCYLDDFIAEKAGLVHTEKELDYYCTFVKGAYLSLVKHWIQTGMEESPEYMVKLSMKFLSRNRIEAMFGH